MRLVEAGPIEKANDAAKGFLARRREQRAASRVRECRAGTGSLM